MLPKSTLMNVKFQIGDIIHDPINDKYFLIEDLKPHSLGVYYCWRCLKNNITGYYEAVLVDNYGEFIKVA